MSFQSPQAFMKFSRIRDLGAFYDPATPDAYKNFIGAARGIIDRVDPDICGYMASFDLQEPKDQSGAITKAVKDTLDDTPIEFLMSLVRYVNVSEMSDEYREKNLITLAGFVAQRFSAISLVAHGKKLNGETTPFHPERHEEVLAKRAKAISISGLNIPCGRKIFGEFMQAGCDIQEAYMNDKEPAHQPMTKQLIKLGINPITRACG